MLDRMMLYLQRDGQLEYVVPVVRSLDTSIPSSLRLGLLHMMDKHRLPSRIDLSD